MASSTGRGPDHQSLQKDNFAIFEDGVKQSISRFEPTVAPFSVVMILDMSGSTLGFRETIRQSAYRFVDALAPDDRVAVIEFYDKVNLRNDFTTDRRRSEIRSASPTGAERRSFTRRSISRSKSSRARENAGRRSSF
ncbi:MAG: hypothetical protein IPJ30_17030 [Acidobacteria bacterium]|nr:hypothetical protein [Acidobacteriota bacterium]